MKRLNEVLPEAQDICRDAILRIVSDGAMPNWSEIVLDKEFVRRAGK